MEGEEIRGGGTLIALAGVRTERVASTVWAWGLGTGGEWALGEREWGQGKRTDPPICASVYLSERRSLNLCHFWSNCGSDELIKAKSPVQERCPSPTPFWARAPGEEGPSRRSQVRGFRGNWA